MARPRAQGHAITKIAIVELSVPEKSFPRMKNLVKKFIKLKIKRDNSSNKVIGIAEIKEHLEKKLDLKEVQEKISVKTRQYAKRQSTWSRGQMLDWNKINFKDLKKFLKKI